MKSHPLAAAAVAASFGVCGLTLHANSSTNDILEAKSSIELPTVEASVNYRTAKIEYGMVENDESIFGYEVEIGWYGFFGGFEACHDMTGINDRRGRYNEIESFLGYGFTWGDFSAKDASS